MMTLADIAKDLVNCDSSLIYSDDISTKVYKGQIDRTNDYCVGLYARRQVASICAISSKSSYNVFPVEILVHWGQQYSEAEAIANKIYDYFCNKSNYNMGGVRVVSVEMDNTIPIDIGRDSNNIQEFNIPLQITYER